MKNTKLLTAIFFALILSVSLNPLFAQSNGTGIIKGCVLDADTKKPIKDAMVLYRFSSQDSPTLGARTDADGCFLTKRFETGLLFYLTAQAEGYSDVHKNVVVEERGPEVLIYMEKQQKVNVVTRNFKVVHRQTEHVYQMIKSQQRWETNMSPALRTITVKAPERAMPEVEKLIQKYDTPLKQLWVEVTFIKASGENGKKNRVSKEIEDVVKKLTPLFSFSHYEVIGRTDAMGLENSVLKSANRGETAESPMFEMGARIQYLDGVIRLENFEVNMIRPLQRELSTSVNIKDGDTVVVGLSRSGSEDAALVTVVKAKVMN